MIDTIVLLLTEDTFQINDPDKFIPSAQWIFADNRGQSHGIISKQNPTKRELRNGIYKARLTLKYRANLQGQRGLVLKVELSLPKLCFGNNFEELRYKDRHLVVEKLVDVLKQMGVVVTAHDIAFAPVVAIHYSKNIPLTDGSTPYHYISKIKEANVKLSLDTNQTDYRNEGHCYKWHCNTYEIVFYDKIKDLEKAKTSSKRAVEKDNYVQLHLFDSLRKKANKFEVLRMEVRLNKRQKIKQLFAKLGIKADLIFKKLFKPAIAKKILLHYLDELESKRPPLFDYKGTNNKALLADLIFNNPTLSTKRILQLYGLKYALDVMSPRELRIMFAGYNARSWYRLMAEAKEIKLSAIEKPFEVIKKYITKLKPLKLKKS